MEFVIRGEARENKRVEFWLEERNGEIRLLANGWVLLAISKEGSRRAGLIVEDLGFPVDDDGRIRIDG